MTNNAQELIQMKEQIEQADRKKSELQGQMREVLARIKKEFECSTLEQGEKKLDQMRTTLDKKQKQLDNGVVKLQKKMEEVDES